MIIKPNYYIIRLFHSNEVIMSKLLVINNKVIQLNFSTSLEPFEG